VKEVVVMDYEKIGEFIFKLRKEKNLTQKQLAEKLNVTNKAISKWERGLGAPDVSLLRQLSEILEISVNELLLGERIDSLTKEQSDKVLVESVLSYQEEGIKKTISFSLTIFMFLFFAASLIIFNASMIISKFYLYTVFAILACLFISVLLSIKLLNDNKIKKTIVLITCIGYSVSLLSYTLYTGISYYLNNIKISNFDFNIIPFKTILTTLTLVITKVQPLSLLFDYIIIDLILFTPYSLFIPYLYGERFKLKKFILTFFTIITIKEIFQLITGYGVLNIDDIFLNFLGLVLAYLFFKKFKFIKNN